MNSSNLPNPVVLLGILCLGLGLDASFHRGVALMACGFLLIAYGLLRYLSQLVDKTKKLDTKKYLEDRGER